jgi:hypothetical protein
MLLLTTMQLFVNGLLFVLVTTTLLLLIVIVVTSYVMWSEFAFIVVILIQFVTIDLIIDLM